MAPREVPVGRPDRRRAETEKRREELMKGWRSRRARPTSNERED